MNVTLTEVKDALWIVGSILAGCLFICGAIFKHTKSFTELVTQIKSELKNLGKGLNEVKQAIHDDLIPQVNEHGERLSVLENLNGKYLVRRIEKD